MKSRVPDERRFLVATSFLPEPALFGATQRTRHLVRALERLGRVDLLAVRSFPRLSEPEEAHLPHEHRLVGIVPFPDRRPPLLARALGPAIAAETAALRRYTPDPEARGICAALRARRYDAIVSRTLSVMCRIDGFGWGAPALVDIDDVDHFVLASQIRQAHGDRPPLRARLKLRIHSALVPRRMRRCDHVFFASQDDRRRCPRVRGSVLPNIPGGIPESPPPPSATPPRLLFVGQLKYKPNLEGVRRFLERSWPGVRERLPAARLRLVGEIDDEPRAAWSALPGLEVTGRVPALDEHYAAATACVAPVFFGGGTNIKVLEAAAHGRACLVSPFSHYGFEDDLRDGASVLRAEDDSAFTRHALTLLSGDGTAARLGARAREVVVERYSFEHFARVVREAVEAVARGRA